MNGQTAIILAASGWIVWAVKEIISSYWKRKLARYGLQSFIEGHTLMLCDIKLEDGSTISANCYENMLDKSEYQLCDNYRIEIDGNLFNDTDVQLVYEKPALEIWGVEGPRLLIHSPCHSIFDDKSGKWVEENPSRTITVPPHGMSRIRLIVLIAGNQDDARSMIRKYYYDSVILMKLQTPTGKEKGFRVCTRSFCGRNKVIWNKKRPFPTYNIWSLNDNGRSSGYSPQVPILSKPCNN